MTLPVTLLLRPTLMTVFKFIHLLNLYIFIYLFISFYRPTQGPLPPFRPLLQRQVHSGAPGVKASI